MSLTKTVSLFVLLSLTLNLFAQNLNLEWAFNVPVVTSSGYYPSNFVYDAQLTSNQDLYLCGNVFGIADFDPSSSTKTVDASNLDAYVAKYDSAGKFLWVLNFGDTTYKRDHTESMTVASNGDIYITGLFFDNVDFDPSSSIYNLQSQGINADVFFGKYTTNGALVWVKSIGTAGFDRPYSIRLDNSGNLLLAGRFENTMDFDPSSSTYNVSSKGAHDIYVAKYDLNGNFKSVFTMGGKNYDRATNMEIASNNDIIIAGHFSDSVDFDPSPSVAYEISNGDLDYFVARYDSSGKYIWSKSFGDTTGELNIEMAVNSSGDILLTGSFLNIVDLDPGVGVINKGSVGANSMFLSKFSGNGNFLWTEILGSKSYDESTSLKIGPNDQIILSGVFTDTAIFNPKMKSDTLISNGLQDIFIASYSDSAFLNWVLGVGSSRGEIGGVAVLGTSNYLYMGASISGVTDFDPSSSTYNVTPTFGFNICASKYSPCYSVYLKESGCYGSYYIFPDGDSSNKSITHRSLVPSSNGCDSVVVTDLIILGGEFQVYDTICQGFNYVFPDGTSTNKDTIQKSYLVSSTGCDSIIVTHLRSKSLEVSLSFSQPYLIAKKQNGYIYVWVDCESDQKLDSSYNNTFLPPKNGKYKVRIYHNGCFSSSSCYEVIGVIINEFENDNQILIFPNPVNERVNVKFSKTMELIEIGLLNVHGQIINNWEFKKSNLISININYLEGVYFLRIATPKSISIHKILVD